MYGFMYPIRFPSDCCTTLKGVTTCKTHCEKKKEKAGSESEAEAEAETETETETSNVNSERS
jgi:hypothetical protein